VRAAFERRPGLRALVPLAGAIVVVAFIPPVLWVTGLTDHRNRSHPVRSNQGIRKLDLKYERDYQYEAAFEKCGILRPADAARRLRVSSDIETVARAYAEQHAPDIRETVFKACRDAFEGAWRPPSDGTP
jgi:hypothetical protein